MDADKVQKSTTTDGQPPRPGFENASAPAPVDPKTGQHGAYWVLSEEERAKGFVRPYRNKYRHLKCGSETSMSTDIAQTYARDPKYYGATFCCCCGGHFGLKDHTKDDAWAFEWMDGEPVGSNAEEAAEYLVRCGDYGLDNLAATFRADDFGITKEHQEADGD